MAYLREHRWVRRLLAWNAYVGCLASGKRGRTWDYSTKAWKSASGALQSFKVIDHFDRYEASLLKTTCVMHFFLSPPMLEMESPFLLRDFDHESPLFWLPPDFTAPNICFSTFFFPSISGPLLFPVLALQEQKFDDSISEPAVSRIATVWHWSFCFRSRSGTISSLQGHVVQALAIEPGGG